MEECWNSSVESLKTWKTWGPNETTQKKQISPATATLDLLLNMNVALCRRKRNWEFQQNVSSQMLQIIVSGNSQSSQTYDKLGTTWYLDSSFALCVESFSFLWWSLWFRILYLGVILRRELKGLKISVDSHLRNSTEICHSRIDQVDWSLQMIWFSILKSLKDSPKRLLELLIQYSFRIQNKHTKITSIFRHAWQ